MIGNRKTKSILCILYRRGLCLKSAEECRFCHHTTDLDWNPPDLEAFENNDREKDDENDETEDGGDEDKEDALELEKESLLVQKYNP
mmetsp:Transcript_664/g.611  ORF Transcript_664/g.611 Transcript_664/m.611 type:complete len:87 (-) Transcript_664:2012-2272(-)